MWRLVSDDWTTSPLPDDAIIQTWNRARRVSFFRRHGPERLLIWSIAMLRDTDNRRPDRASDRPVWRVSGETRLMMHAPARPTRRALCWRARLSVWVAGSTSIQWMNLCTSAASTRRARNMAWSASATAAVSQSKISRRMRPSGSGIVFDVDWRQPWLAAVAPSVRAAHAADVKAGIFFTCAGPSASDAEAVAAYKRNIQAVKASGLKFALVVAANWTPHRSGNLPGSAPDTLTSVLAWYRSRH